MEAIEVLMQEHRTIEQVLEALERFAEGAARSRRTDKEELSRFVRFFREFADGRHHAKEEGVLFQAMVQQGFPSQGGPIPVMLSEHEHGRALVGALAQLAQQDAAWSDEDLAHVAQVARAYGVMLRGHIRKEDLILYPMAERHLPEAAARKVSEACRGLDAAAGGADRDRLPALAEELIARHVSAAYRVA